MATLRAGSAIRLAILTAIWFTIAVLVWYLASTSTPWSHLPALGDRRGIGFQVALWEWLEPCVYIALSLIGVVALLLESIGKRALIPPVAGTSSAILACLAAGAVYLPFYWTTIRHAERLAREVSEPAWAYRLAAILFVVAMAECAVFFAVTRMPRTPALTRGVATVMPVTLAGIYLNLWSLMAILPPSNQWRPVDWHRPDLLTSFRPCRGALVWSRNGSRAVATGRIDDLWMRFADPREGGRETRAISIMGEFREASYIWITPADGEGLRVRTDDPAVIHCDARWRKDPVNPEPWHEVGGKSIIW